MNDPIRDAYAFIRKRKRHERERNSPRWKLAAAAAVDKLPLTGSPRDFIAPGQVEEVWHVKKRDRLGKEPDCIVYGPEGKLDASLACEALAIAHRNAGFPRYRFFLVSVHRSTK